MNFKSENEVLYKKHLCYTYFKRKKIKQLSLILNWIREGDKYQPSTLLSDGNFIVDVFKKINFFYFLHYIFQHVIMPSSGENVEWYRYYKF